MYFGNMMSMPLLINTILTHATENSADQEILTALDSGDFHSYTYRDLGRRVKELALGMSRRGIRLGDRVGTLAWNTYRHLEIYYATAGMGAVCHTVNPRLTPKQIEFIINDAQDSVVFYDHDFASLVENLRPNCSYVKHWVLLTEEPKDDKITCYGDWLCKDIEAFEWPDIDENAASALCYTSGTTGDPKGVLYSHRSTVLHAYASCHPNALAISCNDTVMPLVPMFHVNAWGLPYSTLLSGAKLVLPGANMKGDRVYELCERAGVTISAAVPTVWKGVLDHLESSNLKFSTLKRIVIGGAACPISMISSYAALGTQVLHVWGMTEVSPLGTVCQLLPKHTGLSEQETLRVLSAQGRPLFGVGFKIVDDGGNKLPHDGVSIGHLMIRGNWVVSKYFGRTELATEDGWFRTGDIGVIDHDGYLRITDRSKDVIKSGGEWISSIELENIAMEIPGIEMAGCIGIADEKWGERPVLFVVASPGSAVTNEDILDWFQGRIARWAMPDRVIFIERMPMTATGKLNKAVLRTLPEAVKS